MCPHCRNLYRLFVDVWRVLLDPFLSGDPGAMASDAAEGFAYMLHRTEELLKRGPQGVACATGLLRFSIKRVKKYTRYKHLSLEVFERHLAGELEANQHPSRSVRTVASGKGRRR
jgi:predicted kinase